MSFQSAFPECERVLFAKKCKLTTHPMFIITQSEILTVISISDLCMSPWIILPAVRMTGGPSRVFIQGQGRDFSFRDWWSSTKHITRSEDTTALLTAATPVSVYVN
jgi:hypothetical protein